jgi:aryl-alcohol dehydrogenase-like predicted oxidoreductase
MPRFQPGNLGKNIKVSERVTEMAKRKGCTLSKLALMWVHHQGRDVCPIPGTTKIENFKQNVGALYVKLTQDEMAELESFTAAGIVQGDQHFQMNSTRKKTPSLSLSSRKYDLVA